MPPLPELFVLRHGETEWNRAGRMQGGLDSPLTDLGRAQACAMGGALAAIDVGPATHCILSSPQGRCVATAQLAFGCDPATDPRLSEIAMGDWAGLTAAEIAVRWPGPSAEDFMALYARIPNGESFTSLAARCEALLATLDRPTIIVTHGMTSRFLRALALGLAPADVPGGQGVIHHLSGQVARIIPTTSASGLQNAGPGGNTRA